MSRHAVLEEWPYPLQHRYDCFVLVERLVLMPLREYLAYCIAEGILEVYVSTEGVRVSHIEHGQQTSLAQEAYEATGCKVWVPFGLERLIRDVFLPSGA